MNITKRHFEFALEVRDVDQSAPVIRGYAAVFSPAISLDLGGFRETIKPGAFSRSLEQGNDIVGLWSHDWAQPIGRRSAGTLSLQEDDHGLAIEITPDDTSWSQDALKAVRSGNVTGMSFGFIPTQDSWDYDARIRTLEDVTLLEVSLVVAPAYPDTEAHVRSLLTELEDSYSANLQRVTFAALNVRKLELLRRK